MESLTLSLKRNTLPVTLTDDDGIEKNYELRELSGADRDRYLTDMSKRMSYGKDGKAQGISNFDGLQARLVSMSLYDSEGKQVPFDQIQSFPAKVLSALFDAAQELSALNVSGEEAAKND